MRRLILAATTVALCTSAASAASSSRFEETITLPSGSAVKVNVVLSEDMAHRAENLPVKRSDRSSARNSRDGFGGNGFYGEKDLSRLQEKLADKVVQALDENGVSVSDTAGYTLNVTIADARPNRPTFRQLSKSPSLSVNSISIGGAELMAQLVDGSGNVIGTSSYAWYESNLGDSLGIGTWRDAEYSFSRFARETGKSILD